MASSLRASISEAAWLSFFTIMFELMNSVSESIFCADLRRELVSSIVVPFFCNVIFVIRNGMKT